MSTGNLSNIVAATPSSPAGGIRKGTATAVLPTSATSSIDAATWLPLGIVTDKGVTIDPKVNTKEERDWSGRVVKTIVTDSSVDLSFELYEMLALEVLQAAYGEDAVEAVAATTDHGDTVSLVFKGELPDAAPFIIDAKDGKARIRIVFPSLQITEPGQIVLSSTDTTKPALKGTAYPDADGVLFYLYTDNGATTA